MGMLAAIVEDDTAARDIADRARMTLDEHWAVAGLPADRRRLLLERADAAALKPGEGLGEPIADGLALLGTAYELAALSHLDVALHPTADAAREVALAAVELGAARAFRCHAALRAPTDEPLDALRWSVRLGALAVVARQSDAYSRWWTVRSGAFDAVRSTHGLLDDQPWDRYMRSTLWLAWLGLLGAPLGTLSEPGRLERSAIAATRSRLATLRERRVSDADRTARDQASNGSSAANAVALRSRMTEFALRHVADATELLTVAIVRRTLPDVSAPFKLHLSAARSALAGDHGEDVLLAWLQAAGVTLAGGVTAQLELPGF